MKLITVLAGLLMFSSLLMGQSWEVPADRPVYGFLEEMSVKGADNSLDVFNAPLSHKTILEHLRLIEKRRGSLSVADIERLDYYLSLYNDIYNSASGFPGYYRTRVDSNFTVLLSARISAGLISVSDSAVSMPVEPVLYLHSELTKNLAIRLQLSNGKLFGKKGSAFGSPEYFSNFKLNEAADETFFDNTEGSLKYENDYLSAGIGRGRILRGYYGDKFLISGNSPVTDYLSFSINSKVVSYDYLHCRLLGSDSTVISPVYGPLRTITEKYLAYHRIAFTPFSNFRFGIGEAVIYSRRGPDLSYLNPVAFYKSVEHSNRDRDNALMFLDASYNVFQNFKITGLFVVDDVDFSTLGTGWIANKFAWQINGSYGFSASGLSGFGGVSVSAIDPYTYSHRIPENAYTNFGLPVGPAQPSNSMAVSPYISLSGSGGINVKLSGEYIIHGANEFNSDGSLKVNHGGSYFYGWTENDSKYNSFLGGVKKRYFSAQAEVKYLPNYAFDVNFRLRYGYLNFKNFENKVLQLYCIVGFNF